MGDGHDAGVGVGEEDGHAVGDEDAERDVGRAGDEAVGLPDGPRQPAELVGTRDLEDVRPVHLRGEGDGRAHRRAHASPVLGDGHRRVTARRPKVEARPRGRGDAAVDGREDGTDPGTEVDLDRPGPVLRVGHRST